MKKTKSSPQFHVFFRFAIVLVGFGIVSVCPCHIAQAADPTDVPAPLLKKGHPVDWWFVFKFNSSVFPGCSGGATRMCQFGGAVQNYKAFGQQFVYASSENGSLQMGSDCAGDTTAEPIGATFEQVYDSSVHYVVWNDQFYDDPKIKGCTKECGDPWGHSKGTLVWNDAGEGFVLQVTTPSWPAAGSNKFPRNTDGNTLGCVKRRQCRSESAFLRSEVDQRQPRKGSKSPAECKRCDRF
jgi:hypothetical protein